MSHAGEQTQFLGLHLQVQVITTVECQPSRLRQGYTNKWDTWGLRLSPACVNTESQSAQDVLVLAFYSHGNKL